VFSIALSPFKVRCRHRQPVWLFDHPACSSTMKVNSSAGLITFLKSVSIGRAVEGAMANQVKFFPVCLYKLVFQLNQSAGISISPLPC
jgi:hypothetical protein